MHMVEKILNNTIPCMEKLGLHMKARYIPPP